MPITLQTQHNVIVIAQAIVETKPCSAIYTDGDGVKSVRMFTPSSIERRDNGETIVRAYDHNREAPRSFRLNRIHAISIESYPVPEPAQHLYRVGYIAENGDACCATVKAENSALARTTVQRDPGRKIACITSISLIS